VCKLRTTAARGTEVEDQKVEGKEREAESCKKAAGGL
jgi:hypothetical protein